MDKLKQDNAFTMIESLFILLIISILSISIPKITFKDTMEITMKDIVDLCVYTQEKAFLNKEKTYIDFDSRHVLFDEYTYDLPSNVTCDVGKLYFNEKGNINQASTIHCRNNHTSYKIVFQLGSGRVRYERE